MILFLDDEPRYSRPYVAELSYEWRIVYTDSVDEAVQLLREAGPGEVEAVVLDIMMPPGESLGDEETRDGLDTGIRFFEQVRRDHPALPIIVLTNVTDPAVARRFESEPKCLFLRKYGCLPHELSQMVKEILTGEAGLKNNAI